MAEPAISFSTDTSIVAKIFAAMHLASLATVPAPGDTNAQRAAAYAESFKLIYAEIGTSIKG